TVFSQNPLPAGKNIGIITNAGGLGVLATDASVKHGLRIATLSPKTNEILQSLPPAAGHNNPVDVLGDALADRYQLAIEALVCDTGVDMLLVIVTPQTMTEAKKTAEAIALAKNHSGKPIVAVFSGKASLEEGLAILKQNGVATVTYPESGASALSTLAEVAAWRGEHRATPFLFNDIDKETAKQVFERAKQEHRTTLYETEVWTILEAYGFRFLNSRVAKSAEEAVTQARSFAGPMALKIISPDITHKSDAGGVLLGVKPAEAREKYEELMARVRERVPNATLEGALMVEMAPAGGREIILGVKHEPGLGKLLMVGLGGIFVEVFKDVAFRFSPLFQEDAQEMISELQSLPLLTGTRGQDGIDNEALVASIGRLSQLIEDFPEIEELDINPLLTFKNGPAFRVLDARITLTSLS
ncbi:MAG: acetate--CoA ligase family protein, partial [Candidatus Moranbacteria bacterium]|nr:acetate--CoA ligase family protein [Candidatus Moranbacteria bacterium]